MMYVAILRVHGLNRRWATWSTATWLSVYLFGAVALPLRYPAELLGEVVATGLVVGLILPAVAVSRLLDEGPAFQVLTAARPMLTSRLGWSSAVLVGQTAVAALVASGMSTTPQLLVVADALLLTAAAALSVALFGSSLAWLLPLLLVSVFTAPDVVPWSVNVLYRHSLAPVTFGVAAAVSVAAVATYAFTGSVGLWSRWRGTWRDAADPAQDS